MSADKSDSESSSADITKPIMIGTGIVSVVVLLLAFLTLFLVLDMRGDVAVIAEQSKKALKMSKAIEDDLAEIQKAMPKEKASTAMQDRADQPRAPAHIDAVDTSNDCVIRPGSGKGLSDCLAPVSR